MYISPRQSGKTTKMIDMIQCDDTALLLTFSLSEEIRLKNLLPDECKHQVLYWRDYLKNKVVTRGMFAYSYERVLLDNADMILQDLFRNRLKVISMTSDEMVVNQEIFVKKPLDIK